MSKPKNCDIAKLKGLRGEYANMSPRAAMMTPTARAMIGAVGLLLAVSGVPLLAERPATSADEAVPEEVVAEVYIPADLEDCFAELKHLLPAPEVERMKSGQEADMVRYHHGLGMQLRNEWGLRSEASRLAKWFNTRGVHNADDMSGIILDSFWRHLNGKPLELESQIRRYQEYWQANHRKSASEADPVVYVAVAGDDLSAIATMFLTTTNDLMAANALTAAVVVVGQRLIIPERQDLAR